MEAQKNHGWLGYRGNKEEADKSASWVDSKLRKSNEEREKVAKADSNYRATEGRMKEDEWTYSNMHTGQFDKG